MADMRASFHVWALLAAMIVYGAFGSPTPENFGLAEMAVGFFLILAVDPIRMVRMFEMRSTERWIQLGMILFLYGLSVPVLAAVMRGNAPMLVIRDIIPFLFILLPLLLYHLPMRSKIIIAGGVAAVGVLFAARILIPPVLHIDLGAGPGADPLYLSIAPTVLYAAIILTGMAGWMVYQRCTLMSLMRAGVCLALAALPLAAMAMTLQRASLGLFAVSIVVMMGIAVIRAPVRAMAPLALAACLAALSFPFWGDVVVTLLHKHHLVGSNMRWQEAAAVFDEVDHSLFAALLGHGWGAQVESPAVGGMMVNFTHNLMTTYWLKAGVAGVVLMMAYLLTLSWPLMARIKYQPVIILALGAPLVIDCLFYASFKSLDFGLILLLIALWTRAEKAETQDLPAVARSPGVVYP